MRDLIAGKVRWRPVLDRLGIYKVSTIKGNVLKQLNKDNYYITNSFLGVRRLMLGEGSIVSYSSLVVHVNAVS
jgi:hypothetical protein